LIHTAYFLSIIENITVVIFSSIEWWIHGKNNQKIQPVRNITLQRVAIRKIFIANSQIPRDSRVKSLVVLF